MLLSLVVKSQGQTFLVRRQSSMSWNFFPCLPGYLPSVSLLLVWLFLLRFCWFFFISLPLTSHGYATAWPSYLLLVLFPSRSIPGRPHWVWLPLSVYTWWGLNSGLSPEVFFLNLLSESPDNFLILPCPISWASVSVILVSRLILRPQVHHCLNTPFA